MANYTTTHPLTTDKDISSEAFWHKSFVERDETFAWLRANAPVSWHEPLQDENLPPEVHGEAGYWAVTLAEDIKYISVNHELFSSAGGNVMLRPRHPDEVQVPNFLEMDPPEHTQYRKVMSSAFTPKAVRQLEDKIQERALKIVERVVGAGEIDFVSEVSAKLPMLTIADMIGVPESQIEAFTNAADGVVGRFDESKLPDDMSPVEFVVQQFGVLREIGVDLVNHRRSHPADDIATALANAEFDGQRISDDQISSIMLLLSVAGNDTTKQTTTSTVIALDRNPDQKAWLREDFNGRIGSAVEEFVRHASPVMVFARTATKDLELRGQQIDVGDKVAIFYCSGNRDETLFPDPHRFDLSRQPNKHVAFGGGGVHYCLGHSIAKTQLRSLFEPILRLLPDLEVIGDPAQLYTDFINGTTQLPVRV